MKIDDDLIYEAMSEDLDTIKSLFVVPGWIILEQEYFVSERDGILDYYDCRKISTCKTTVLSIPES